MLEWLLKYPLNWYAAGSLEIAWPWQIYAVALLSMAVLLFWLPGYRRVRRGIGSFLLRTALLAVLLLALAGPTLVVETPEPIRGHVAMLLDDSLSLRLADADGMTGAARMDALFGGDPESLGHALQARFDVRPFRFGETVEALEPGARLRHADARSEMGEALQHVVTAADAESLAAVVVASDGGGLPSPDAQKRLDSALLALRAAGVPVHVVALDSRDGNDLELRRMRLPRQVLVRDGFDVDVEMTHRGLGGQTATLVIEDDGLLVDRYRFTLPRDRASISVRRRLGFDTVGRRLLTARVEPLATEHATRNNRLDRSLDVTDRPVRVLHFEAEPRFEVKFARRAVADDPAIRLTSLVRTADNKYHRLGVESPEELAEGFPAESADLFRYHVLVLGSVEAGLLSERQQRAVREFVSRRGGGLLLLGGRRALAEGGYAASPLAALLPVHLAPPATDFRREVRLRPTAAGLADPLLDFGGEETREALFRRLPPLTVLNPLREAKPGARVLLEGTSDGGEPLIALADQSFGRGRVMIFAVSNSWRWQLGVDKPLEDQTHETLWRKLLRELGRRAGDRVQVTVAEPGATPGEAVNVTARALDSVYQPMPGASLSLAVTGPLGTIRRYPMTPDAASTGDYRAAFVADAPGRYDLAVTLADAEGEAVASAEEYVDVSTAGREFRDQALGRRILDRVAAETGGRIVAAGDASELLARIDDSRGSRTVLRRLPLWDAPVLLLAALALACADWLLRRRRNLA